MKNSFVYLLVIGSLSISCKTSTNSNSVSAQDNFEGKISSMSVDNKAKISYEMLKNPDKFKENDFEELSNIYDQYLSPIDLSNASPIDESRWAVMNHLKRFQLSAIAGKSPFPVLTFAIDENVVDSKSLMNAIKKNNALREADEKKLEKRKSSGVDSGKRRIELDKCAAQTYEILKNPSKFDANVVATIKETYDSYLDIISMENMSDIDNSRWSIRNYLIKIMLNIYAKKFPQPVILFAVDEKVFDSISLMAAMEKNVRTKEANEKRIGKKVNLTAQEAEVDKIANRTYEILKNPGNHETNSIENTIEIYDLYLDNISLNSVNDVDNSRWTVRNYLARILLSHYAKTSPETVVKYATTDIVYDSGTLMLALKREAALREAAARNLKQ
jgi:hypothetical protein